MKPRFAFPELFHAEVTDRFERSFLFRRDVFRVRWESGFCLVDRDGNSWRPDRPEYDSDAASIPHPLDWIFPCFNVLRYKRASMGIHDPACRFGRLAKWNPYDRIWEVVEVRRPLADSLFQQGIQAEGGWKLTRGAYWLGVRIGCGFKR